ncbi:DNA repair protein rad16, partial [Linderina macrospora]
MVTTRSKSRSQPTDLAPTDPAPAPTVPAKRGRSRRPARTITQSSSTTTLVAASATPAVDGSDTAPSSGTVTPGSKKVVFVVADDSDSDDGDSDFVNSGDSSDDFVSDHGESSAQRPRTRASDRAFVAAAEDQLDEAENERRALGDERRQLRRNETMAEMRLRDFDAELDIIRDQVDTAGAGEEEREQLREAAVEDRLEERDQLRQQYEEAAREHASREPELTQSIRSINQRIWDLRRGVPRARRLAPARPRGSRAKSRKRSKTKDEPELDIDAPPEGDLDHYHRPELFLHHPQLKAAWKSLPEPPEMQMTEQPPNLKIRLLPFQREGVWWMARQEGTQFRGGILADEMGMGKTLQTIGLMLVNRGKPTLVICPTVALLQWKSEIEAATDDLSVFLYYGADRKKLADDKGDLDPSELTKYDVVLTTYSVLETGFRRERYGYRRQGELRHEDSVLHK